MSCPPTGCNDNPASLGWGCAILASLIGLMAIAIMVIYHA